MSKLDGKTALITGGSRGIGASIALHFAREGANVAITYSKSADQARTVVKKLLELGVKAEAYQADAGDSETVAQVVRQVAEQFGELHILVNNAGIFLAAGLPDITDEEFERAVAVNVRGVFTAAREAAKVLPEGGRIINLGSGFGERVPFPGLSLYAMTKFAVAGLTRGWARDLGPQGITVNAIQPGPIETEANPIDGDFAPVLIQATALGRFGQVEEIATLATFLASPEASYITGAILNADGGAVA